MSDMSGSKMSDPASPIIVERGLWFRISDGARRFFDGDVFYSFKRSPVVMVAFAVTMVFFLMAFLAPWIAPHNTYDVVTLNLMDAFKPPVWEEGGDPSYLLGTDDQGRDVLSTIMFGARVSLTVGFLSVILAMVMGIVLGLVAGYVGGVTDAVIMRIADVQLSFPAILIVLLIDGFTRSLLPRGMHEEIALVILVLAIAFANWALDVEAQTGFTNRMFYGPTNAKATPNQDALARTAADPRYRDRVIPLDWNDIVQVRDTWNNRWRREVIAAGGR